MGIPYARVYTVSQRGVRLKDVTCEYCQAEFVYVTAREADGAGTSLLFLDNDGAEDRATERARAALDKQLAADCDPVPCPMCTLYQPNMVRKIREGKYGGLQILGALSILPGAVCGLILMMQFLDQNSITLSPGWQIFVVVGAAAGFGFGFALFGVAALKKRAFDPNQGSYEEERQACQQPTMLREEFDREGPRRLTAFAEKMFAEHDRSMARLQLAWVGFIVVALFTFAGFLFFRN